MQVRCPHCCYPIELVNDNDFERISCPSCGSQLNLSGGDEDTISAMAAVQIPALQCFQLLEPVGVGQFGRVWRARDTELGRIVAVKLPHARYLSSADAGFFLREARAAAQLNHPHIVRVYEVGRHEDTVYIVSEFIDGMSLREWVQQYRPDVRRSAKVCSEIARALEHAHEKGVVHRDLKPANILMDHAGDPHITDFGLAKQEGTDVTIAATGQVLGTPAYSAPEQIRDGHAADRRSDVYSLGVILYEMLAGERPFLGGRRLLLQQVLHDEPHAPRSVNRRVPKDLQTICLKALAKRPEQRYATAAALADDLERFLAGQPVMARRTSLPLRALRWSRRRPALTATLLLSLVVLALVPLALRRRELVPSRTARPIALTTAPEGATVVMIPINRMTGMPEFNLALQVGASPVRATCEPGDYLVVACRDETLFHEVYRHVPAAQEKLPRPFAHFAWGQSGDTIILPTIQLFATLEVTADMAHVSPGEFTLDTTVSTRDVPVTVPEFFVDVTEVTVGQLRKRGFNLPFALTDEMAPDEMPLYNVSWDEAVNYAEVLGKRLLREEEFQYLVTLAGTQTNNPAHWQVAAAVVPGPVTDAAWDRLDWDRLSKPLVGMRSNVLEWTSTRWSTADGDTSWRIVRGGYSLGDDSKAPNVDRALPPPRRRMVAPAATARLGFRCARSARPAVSP
jgi:eukaryotic-like serine/threonine-protein kinase